MVPESVVRLEKICKSYYGNPVLNSVDFSIEKGSVHGLIGLNGAGKTTLSNILSGITQPDSGLIILNGKTVSLPTPLAAKKAGISTIHQNLNMNFDISIAEYVYMNVSVVHEGNFHYHSASSRISDCQKLFDELHFDLDPRVKMKELNIGQRQYVQIAASLALHPKLLILDEPYSMLTRFEADQLTDIFSRLAERGMGILLITHEMSDIIKMCDRISILKDGTCSSVEKNHATKEELLATISKNEKEYYYPYIRRPLSYPILSVKNLKAGTVLKNVCFELKKGEILGLAGLLGSGKSTLARTLVGIRRMSSGEILYNGEKIRIRNPSDAVKYKISLLPEDLTNEGILEAFTVSKNISLANLRGISPLKFIDYSKEHDAANKFLKKYVIRASSIYEATRNLSAGNKQKVNISKWMFSDSSILIMDDPTQSLDISSKVEIYNFMTKFTAEGGSILFISSDFNELLGMCDRILVLKSGTIKTVFQRSEFSEKELVKALSQ